MPGLPSRLQVKARRETPNRLHITYSATELDSLESPLEFLYHFVSVMPFRDLPKSVRQNIRDLAALAHDRELATELHRIDGSFSLWRSGSLGSHELNDEIHRFHDGASRRLWKLYTDSDPSIAVASAIARGILPQSEVPPGVMQELRAMIAAFSERRDEHDESKGE